MAIREQSDHRQPHECSGSNVGTMTLSPPVVSQQGIAYLPVFFSLLSDVTPQTSFHPLHPLSGQTHTTLCVPTIKAGFFGRILRDRGR
jgi:hypothetical protein